MAMHDSDLNRRNRSASSILIEPLSIMLPVMSGYIRKLDSYRCSLYPTGPIRMNEDSI